MSPSHFARRFRAAYGETPYGFLMTRRVERAMALLRRGDDGAAAVPACVARAWLRPDRAGSPEALAARGLLAFRP